MTDSCDSAGGEDFKSSLEDCEALIIVCCDLTFDLFCHDQLQQLSGDSGHIHVVARVCVCVCVCARVCVYVCARSPVSPPVWPPDTLCSVLRWQVCCVRRKAQKLTTLNIAATANITTTKWWDGQQSKQHFLQKKTSQKYCFKENMMKMAAAAHIRDKPLCLKSSLKCTVKC